MRFSLRARRHSSSHCTAIAAFGLLTGSLLSSLPIVVAAQELPPPREPVSLIFDTDIGNDVDDALALGVIHALQSRGECRLLGVTITKDHDDAARFVDAINTFYGRGDLPIGVCRSGVTPEAGSFNGLAQVRDLQQVEDLPDAVTLLRQLLAAEPDKSVVIAQVGFSSNLAKLLQSPADELGPAGPELVKQKVRQLSLMAGAFESIDGQPYKEYNVVMDLAAARHLAQAWPTEMVYSGFEIGLTITYPSQSILQDYGYVTHHPLAEAYQLYLPAPHDRPNWDLTSVLIAVRSERDYFDLSAPGTITIDEQGLTRHEAAAEGQHRFLVVDDIQRARVREVLAALASQPPDQPRRLRDQVRRRDRGEESNEAEGSGSGPNSAGEVTRDR